jgi:hypothetical protein
MTTTRSAGPRLATTAVQPHEDYGFFGPGSVTWKVWGYPTSLTVGFQRSVVVEELDPNLVATVDKTHDIYRRPRTRYDRTLRYVSMVAFGGSRETATAADVLVKIHSKAIGTEPYGGGRYDANDPASQLWIHLTAWHSILYAYEKYGPGPLSPHEEARYWQECAVAAEFRPALLTTCHAPATAFGATSNGGRSSHPSNSVSRRSIRRSSHRRRPGSDMASTAPRTPTRNCGHVSRPGLRWRNRAQR